MDIAIDFAKRDQGEFFVTFDEFFQLFNKFSVVFDFSKKEYESRQLCHFFTEDNCKGMNIGAKEGSPEYLARDGDIAFNTHYTLVINKRPENKSKPHVIINLQQEDGRLKVNAQSYDPEYKEFKRALYLGVFRMKAGVTKLTSIIEAKKYLITYECIPSWVVGANLENLENGTYVVIPTLANPIVNHEEVKYFLTLYTNLSKDEFKFEGPGTFLTQGHGTGSTPTNRGNIPLNFSKDFLKTSSKLFTSKMIYTELADPNSKVRKGFLETAAFRAMRATYAEDNLEKLLVTPRRFA